MAGTIVEPSKATHGEITLDLSAAAGPAAEERQEDDQEFIGQEDGRKRGEGWGRGETRDSDVPSRRISPLTLLSYKWGYHLRWPQRQGERERGFFFKLTIVLADCAPEEGIGVAACAWVHL